MPDKILHKRNLISGNAPTTASLEPGELAINVADGKLFLRQSGSIADQIVTMGASASFSATASYVNPLNQNVIVTGSLIVSGSSTFTNIGPAIFSGSVNGNGGFSGSFSGSFQGDGSGLTNVSASSIVGLNLSQIATGSISASVSTGTGSFTVTSGSNTFLSISNSGNVTISSSTNITSNLTVTGSLNVLQGITGSLLGTATTASYVLQAISASFATTASYLSNYIPPFPFTGSAQITGSLGVTGSISTSGSNGTINNLFIGRGNGTNGITNVSIGATTAFSSSLNAVVAPIETFDVTLPPPRPISKLLIDPVTPNDPVI